MLIQKYNQALASRFPAQSPQRLQYGHVGFTRPVLLNTLSSPNPQRLSIKLHQKRINEGRLADARLPDELDEAGVARAQSREQRIKRLQLLAAADDPDLSGERTSHRLPQR